MQARASRATGRSIGQAGQPGNRPVSRATGQSTGQQAGQPGCPVTGRNHPGTALLWELSSHFYISKNGNNETMYQDKVHELIYHDIPIPVIPFVGVESCYINILNSVGQIYIESLDSNDVLEYTICMYLPTHHIHFSHPFVLHFYPI